MALLRQGVTAANGPGGAPAEGTEAAVVVEAPAGGGGVTGNAGAAAAAEVRVGIHGYSACMEVLACPHLVQC